MSDSIDAADFVALGQRGRSKYGNKRVKEDGYTFDSIAEHRRYCDLKLMQQQGAISDLTVHPRYPLVVNGRTVATYEADFWYVDADNWEHIEDVKSAGTRTRLYELKRKLMRACYGIDVVEIEA